MIMDGKLIGQWAGSVATTKTKMKTLLKRIGLRYQPASAHAAAAVDPSAPQGANACRDGADVLLARNGFQWMNENGDLAVYRKETYAQVNQTQGTTFLPELGQIAAHRRDFCAGAFRGTEGSSMR
jgi:hypothetical protein